MASAFLRRAAVLLLVVGVESCPMQGRAGSMDLPEDTTHELASALAAIVEKHGRRLQTTTAVDECFSRALYQQMVGDVAALGIAITDVAARAHFWGGIVRLVAHDFMDFDQNSADDKQGQNGCILFTHPANSGLSDIWAEGTALFELYEQTYKPLGVSVADFWVISGNAVVEMTSPGALVLPFRWGRVDAPSCAGSGQRLPGASGCDEVERVFLTNMGLTWRDAVSLMGAHTLGRGLSSGHAGRWVETVEESVIFDHSYYNELVTRPWVPRGNSEFTWGSSDEVMMLKTDICLAFDIDSVNCCTNTNADCQRFKNNQCELATSRPEALAAVREFVGGREENDNFAPWYLGFAEAWEKATEKGHEGLLKEVTDICLAVVATEPPTPKPTKKQRCKDSRKWKFGQKKRRCAWVAKKPMKRCPRKGRIRKQKGVLASDACPRACQLCPDQQK